MAEPDDVAAFAAVRQDFSVSQLLARAMQRFVSAGDLDRHVAVLRDHYRRKRDRTTELLSEHCERTVRFSVPIGGFFFWLELRGDATASELVHRLAERGVHVRNGEWFTDEPYGRRHIRISPMQLNDEDLTIGISTLGEVLASW